MWQPKQISVMDTPIHFPFLCQHSTIPPPATPFRILATHSLHCGHRGVTYPPLLFDWNRFWLLLNKRRRRKKETRKNKIAARKLDASKKKSIDAKPGRTQTTQKKKDQSEKNAQQLLRRAYEDSDRKNKAGNSVREGKRKDKGAQKQTSSTRARTRTPKRTTNPKRETNTKRRKQISDSESPNESKTAALPSLQPVQKIRMLKHQRGRSPNSDVRPNARCEESNQTSPPKRKSHKG